MGDKPCGTDATAFGALAGILTPFFDSKLRSRAEELENLTAYVDRMMRAILPGVRLGTATTGGVSMIRKSMPSATT